MSNANDFLKEKESSKTPKKQASSDVPIATASGHDSEESDPSDTAKTVNLVKFLKSPPGISLLVSLNLVNLLIKQPKVARPKKLDLMKLLS